MIKNRVHTTNYSFFSGENSNINETNKTHCTLALELLDNHDLIDTSAVDNNTRKRDKAPVPIQIWDSRIYLYLPLCKGLNMLVKALHLMLLSFYQKKLTRSFMQYLGTAYPLQHERHTSGHREVRDEGNSEFCYDIAKGREVLHRNTNSSWFELFAGSGLVF